SNDDNNKGFVITHGTDTLEETAYFLNLAVKTTKSVIITGAMRPATAISADGPMNLYQAVCAAASPETEGQGVLAVFADRIYTARSVTKTSTYQLTAISAGRMGAIGVIRDGKVYLYETTNKPHTNKAEFDVASLDTLPKVTILYFHVDASTELLKFAIEHSDGIVIAGAGAGEFSLEYGRIIEQADVPIVVSSRVDDGLITDDMLIFGNTIAANNLSPQKAAVLLRLALTETKDKSRIRAMFAKY
ncbi:MAG: asparaginase, partial [Clostridia bacterium]|nr:asparaginase [Clostridia bacterium]